MYYLKINGVTVDYHEDYKVVKHLLITRVKLFCEMCVSMRIMSDGYAEYFRKIANENAGGVNIHDFAHFEIVSD